MKILFIENSKDDFDSYNELLGEYKVIQHAERKGATEKARRERPDLVIMDVQLEPSKALREGEGLAHEWRRLPEGELLREVPILVLTHFETVESAEHKTGEFWQKEKIWFCSKDRLDVRLEPKVDPGPFKRFMKCLENIRQLSGL